MRGQKWKLSTVIPPKWTQRLRISSETEWLMGQKEAQSCNYLNFFHKNIDSIRSVKEVNPNIPQPSFSELIGPKHEAYGEQELWLSASGELCFYLHEITPYTNLCSWGQWWQAEWTLSPEESEWMGRTHLIYQIWVYSMPKVENVSPVLFSIQNYVQVCCPM